ARSSGYASPASHRPHLFIGAPPVSIQTPPTHCCFSITTAFFPSFAACSTVRIDPASSQAPLALLSLLRPHGSVPASSSMSPHRPICRAVAREMFVTEVTQPGRSLCGTLVGPGREGLGTMRVERVKDVGTTFIVRLPLAAA